MTDITDWRCISQHAVQSLVEGAVDRGDFKSFAPTHLVAASSDALNLVWMLRKVQIYDEEGNPYNPIRGPYEGSFDGARVLLVDKADSSRVSLANALAELSAKLPTASIGIFVLHNKSRPKEADLPSEVMKGRYFSACESDNVAISYPYHQATSQPTAHGDHPHLTGGVKRRSIDEGGGSHAKGHETKSLRVLSRHYIDESIDQALSDQGMLEMFTPDLIIAVDDTALSPTSLLEHHIAIKVGKKTPVLTPQWKVYEPDENPYKPVGRAWDQSLSGASILLVEKVDSTRHTLTAFVESLLERIAKQKVSVGSEFVEPKIAAFAFHNKFLEAKEALHPRISHFFAAETSSDEVKISYPSG